jgi:nitrate reductase molybdenum cofactor assembly chaperone NarJ/NarW
VTSLRGRGAAVVCQSVSILLQYPDQSVRAAVPLIAAACLELPAGPPRAAIEGFLDRLNALGALGASGAPGVTEALGAPGTPGVTGAPGVTGTPGVTSDCELAQHYVATFDRDRRCCLHLTWWTDGETRRRGRTLAALKDRYRRHGLELRNDELPDYLPVVLEYAATGDLADGLAVLREHRAAVELIRLALRDLESPYAALLEAVCALLPGPSPADHAAARRLAQTGPPVESVGTAATPPLVGTAGAIPPVTGTAGGPPAVGAPPLPGGPR